MDHFLRCCRPGKHDLGIGSIGSQPLQHFGIQPFIDETPKYKSRGNSLFRKFSLSVSRIQCAFFPKIKIDTVRQKERIPPHTEKPVPKIFSGGHDFIRFLHEQGFHLRQRLRVHARPAAPVVDTIVDPSAHAGKHSGKIRSDRQCRDGRDVRLPFQCPIQLIHQKRPVQPTIKAGTKPRKHDRLKDLFRHGLRPRDL